jgi:hypothetical protein
LRQLHCLPRRRNVASTSGFPTTEIQVLETRDGLRAYGRLEVIGEESIQFRTISGELMIIEGDRLEELRTVEGRLVNGEFRLRDPHASRLFIGPTARSLRRGEGYVSLHQLTLPSMQVGITDRVSLGAATPIFFYGESHPFLVTPKVQLLAREKLQVAAGTMHLLNIADNSTGIAYGVATFGSRDNAATVAFGYTYAGNERRPVVMLGTEGREGRRVKWVAEGWILGEDAGLLTFGARFLRERYSTELGLVVPLFGPSGYVLPMVNLTFGF